MSQAQKVIVFSAQYSQHSRQTAKWSLGNLWIAHCLKVRTWIDLDRKRRTAATGSSRIGVVNHELRTFEALDVVDL